MYETIAFYDCSNLKEIRFENPLNIEHIGDWAFWNTLIKQIKIPAVIRTKIVQKAFPHVATIIYTKVNEN